MAADANNQTIKAQRIESELSKVSTDPTLLQLATCVRDNPQLAARAARIVVAQRNAAVYDSVLRVSLHSTFLLIPSNVEIDFQSDLSQQHYNFEFRRALWSAIGSLPEGDRRFLFSVDEIVPSPKSISLLHSIRTAKELELASLSILTD